MTGPLTVVLRCPARDLARIRYVVDTLLMALNVPVAYADEPPAEGIFLLYADRPDQTSSSNRCLFVPYSQETWSAFRSTTCQTTTLCSGVPVLVGSENEESAEQHICFDLFANSFWWLTSLDERLAPEAIDTRGLYSNSAFKRLGVPQDIVDTYLEMFSRELESCCDRTGAARWAKLRWPDDQDYAVVLSHDVDFIPSGVKDIVFQGVKTLGRHLIRERNPMDAVRAGAGLFSALLNRKDPYGCLPDIIGKEKSIGVRASYQVAVGHRHPFDVNYLIEDDHTRDYLRTITKNEFELCLHGSYRSTENPNWYKDEVELLSAKLKRPIGSRQHFLSFNYDTLFHVQEECRIQYDMSMGFPDRVGPRAGFSFPYFPWNLEEDRPYNVVEISLFLMDVTLRSYMGLQSHDAWAAIEESLGELSIKRGAVSVVWHPIVFGNARDPGYGDLFWRLIEHVKSTGGLATDGRTINEFWRHRSANYPSFANFG